MDYRHRLRRRSRALGRLLSQSMNRSVWASGLVMPTYWWDGWLNFGDTITPWLMPKLGVGVLHAEPANAEFCATGSLIQDLPLDWAGTIWGTGLIEDRVRVLPNARVLAVRGALTRERMQLSEDVALGDPGLLVARYMRRPSKRWDVVIVPHAYHFGSPAVRDLAATAARSGSVHIVDVRGEVRSVVREIASGARVISTSLHGLVTADSYGLPALWTVMDPPLEGGQFKFRDYETAVGAKPSRFVAMTDLAEAPAREEFFGTIPRQRVDELCEGLLAALAPVTSQPRRGYLAEVLSARRRKLAVASN